MSELEELKAENAKLQAIVDKLPVTANGVPAYKGMNVWCIVPDRSVYHSLLGWFCTYGAAYAHQLQAEYVGYRLNGVWRELLRPVEECYSTEDAAWAAKETRHEC